MDRDLHNRIQWLEEELFEEEGLQEPEFDLDDILSEFLEEEDAPRNRAVEFDRMAFGDEIFDESTALLVTRKKAQKEQPVKAEKKKKGTRGLAILAILEVIAIIAVLLRWALWFL